MNGSSFSYTSHPNVPLLVQNGPYPTPQYYVPNGVGPFIFPTQAASGQQMIFHQGMRGMPQQPNLSRPPPAATQSHGFIQPQILPNLQNPPPLPFTQAGGPSLTHAPPSHQIMRSDQQQFIIGTLPHATSVPPPPAALSSASYDENFQHVLSLDNGGGSRSTSTFSAYGAHPPSVTTDGSTDLHHHLPSSHESFQMHQLQQLPPQLNAAPHTQPLNAPITLMQQFNYPIQNFQDRTILVQQQINEQTTSIVSNDGANLVNQTKIQLANMTISSPENHHSSTNSPPTSNNSIQLSDLTQQTTSGTEFVMNNVAPYNLNHPNVFVKALNAESFVPQNQNIQLEPQPDENNQKLNKLAGRRSGAPTPNSIQNNSQRGTPEIENNQDKNTVTNEGSSWRRGNSTDLHQKTNINNNGNGSNDTRHGGNQTIDNFKTTNYNKIQSRRYENVQICYVCKMNNKPESEYTSHSTITGEKVTCNILKENGCSICGARGEEAHPEIYCNEKESSESFIAFAKSFNDRIYVGNKYNNNNDGHRHYNNSSTYSQNNYYRNASKNLYSSGNKRN